jgi:hypothetical protein
VAPAQGRHAGAQNDAKKAARSLAGSGSFQASYETANPIRPMHCATAHHFPSDVVMEAI